MEDTNTPKRRLRQRVTRKKREEPSEDDGIKTITYDEYVNAGIPDALLQGLGFAESLSKEPVDAEDENDVGKDPAEQMEAPGVDVSSTDVQSEPSVAASAPVVPVSLIQLLSGHIAQAIISGNSSKFAPPSSNAGNNIISSTPAALNLVDRHGNILPTLPSVTSRVGNAHMSSATESSHVVRVADGVGRIVKSLVPPNTRDAGKNSSLIATSDAGKVESRAVKYIDQNGRVLLTGVPYPLSASESSRVIRVVDSDGRIVTSKVPPNTRVVDNNGRVISTVTSSPENVEISQTDAAGESDAGNFQVPLSASADLTRRESKTFRTSTEEFSVPKKKLRTDNDVTAQVQVMTTKRPVAVSSLRHEVNDVAVSCRLSGNKQTAPLLNHMSTTTVTHGTDARMSSRTKGRVRYDRLPTGEVVASIIQEAPTKSTTSTAESVSRRGRYAVHDSSCVLPEGYPINRSNVVAVVEEAHRATQSMRILLTSMREELRRAGGMSGDGGSWTESQCSQRRNVAHRLSVAYQSYRKSIHDIENLRFRNGNRNMGDGNAGPGNPCHEARRTSDIVLSDDSSGSSVVRQVQGFRVKQRRIVGGSRSGGSDQVIDLTD